MERGMIKPFKYEICKGEGIKIYWKKLVRGRHRPCLEKPDVPYKLPSSFK